jgi:hypothetical protein
VDHVEKIEKFLKAGFSMTEAVIPAAAPKNIGRMLQASAA